MAWPAVTVTGRLQVGQAQEPGEPGLSLLDSRVDSIGRHDKTWVKRYWPPSTNPSSTIRAYSTQYRAQG